MMSEVRIKKMVEEENNAQLRMSKELKEKRALEEQEKEKRSLRLFGAALMGNLPKVKILIENGLDPCLIARNFQQPIDYAKVNKSNNKQVMDYLEQEMERRNKLFSEIVRALLENKDISNLLIENKINIDFRNKAGFNLLHLACLANDINFLKKILQYNPNLNLRNGKFGEYPIHAAAQYASPEFLSLLLQKGAELDSKTYTGHSVMVYAFASGKIENIKFLKKRGAFLISQYDSEIEAYKHFSISFDKVDSLKYLKQRGIRFDDINKSLMKAMIINSHQVVSYLLSEGGAIERAFEESDKNWIENIENLEGSLYKKSNLEKLHSAVELGDEELTHAILNMGAKVDSVHGQKGWSELHLAAKHNHIEIVKLLLDFGADINQTGPEGNAINIAALHGHRALLEFLLSKGAKLIQTTAYPASLLFEIQDKIRDIRELCFGMPENVFTSLIKQVYQGFQLEIEKTQETKETKEMKEKNETIQIKYESDKFSIEQLEPYSGKKIKLTYRFDVKSKKETIHFELPRFPGSEITVSAKKAIILKNIIGKSNLSLAGFKNYHLEEMTLEGALDFLDSKTASVHTKKVLVKTLTGIFEKLINRGPLEAPTINCVIAFLDNRQGELYGVHSLKLQTGEINNEQGKILSKNLELFNLGLLNNRNGIIRAQDSMTLLNPGRVNNRHGKIIATDPNAFTMIFSFERIDNLDFGKIKSRGRAFLYAPRIVTDDTSYVKGIKGTTIVGLNVRQETPIVGNDARILAQNLDYKGACATLKNQIAQLNDRLLSIKHPIIGKIVEVLGFELKNYSDILGGSTQLTARRKDKAYPITNYSNIKALTENIVLNTSGLDHQSGKIQAKENVLLPTTTSLKLLAEMVAEKDVFLKTPLKNFEYAQNIFNVRGTFELTLLNGMTFSVPLTNSGSFHFSLDKNAQLPFDFRTNIVCGNNTEDPKTHTLGHLTLNSPGHLIKLGDYAQKLFTKVEATGQAEFIGKELDFQYGTVVGIKKIRCEATAGQAKLGKAPENKNVAGASLNLATHGALETKSAKETLIHGCELQSGSLESTATEVHILGSNVSTGKAFIDAAWLYVRLGIDESRYHLKATSKPTKMIVDGLLKTTGQTKIIGSTLAVRLFEGITPLIENVREYYFRIHKPFLFIKNGTNLLRTYYKDLYLSDYNQGNPISSQQKNINVQGRAIAPAIGFENFDSAVIGITYKNYKLPPPKPFKQVQNTEEFLSSSIDYASTTYPSYFRSILPRPMTFRMPSPVVVHPNGQISENHNKLRTYIDPSEEMRALSKMLLETRGYIFENESQTLEELLYTYRSNAEKLIKSTDDKISTSTALISPDPLEKLKESTEPLWVYIEISVTNDKTNKSETVLLPRLIVPSSWNNPKLRSQAGGLFAIKDSITFRGAARESSALLCTGFMYAKELVVLENMKEARIQKRVVEEIQTVIESETKRRWGFRKTKHTPKQMTTATPQEGGGIEAGGLVIRNVENMVKVGADLQIGQKGIKGENIGNNIERNVYATHIEEASSKKMTMFTGGASTQYITRHSSIPTTTRSEGPIDITANTHSLIASHIHGKDDISLHSNVKTELPAARVTERLADKHSKKGMLYRKEFGTTEKGFVTTIVSDKNLTLTSDGTTTADAPDLQGKKQYIESKYDTVFDSLVLKRDVQAKSRGLSGLKFVHGKERCKQEFGKTAHLVALDSIVMVSTHGNIILVAPQMCALMGDLKFYAPEGEVNFKQATFVTDISIKEFTIALSFFGSSTIDALLRRDFKEALKTLYSEFPILKSMDELRKSDTKADKIGNSLRAAYHAAKTYEACLKANNIWEFMTSQINTDVKVRIGQSKTTIQYTTAILTWLQARNIVMVAKNLRGKGVSGQCDNLITHAKQKIELEAGETHRSSNTVERGVTAGVNLATGMPLVGVDYASQNSKATQYLTSNFKVNNHTSMVAGESISLKGVCIQTLTALLDAETMTVETLQNKEESKSKSFAIGARPAGEKSEESPNNEENNGEPENKSSSIDLDIQYSKSRQERKYVSEQAGIHAQKTLIANIRKQLTLLGGKITTGTEAKPIVGKNDKNESCVFYEYEFFEESQDTIFHALGIPRERILAQLLKNENEAMRTSIAPLIKELLLSPFFSVTLPQSILYPEIKKLRESCCSPLTMKKVLDEVGGEINSYCQRSFTFREFITHCLKAENPINSRIVLALMEAISKLNNININIWMKKDELRLAHQYHSEGSSKLRNLFYDPIKHRFTLLHSKPGLIAAEAFLFEDLKDVDKSRSINVGITNQDFRGKSKDKQDLVKATVSSNIDIQTTSNISNLNRDPNNTRTNIKNKNRTANIPLGQTIGLMKMAYEAHKAREAATVPVQPSTQQIKPKLSVPSTMMKQKQKANASQADEETLKERAKNKFIKEMKRSIESQGFSINDKIFKEEAETQYNKFMRGASLAEMEYYLTTVGASAPPKTNEPSSYADILKRGRDVLVKMASIEFISSAHASESNMSIYKNNNTQNKNSNKSSGYWNYIDRDRTLGSTNKPKKVEARKTFQNPEDSFKKLSDRAYHDFRYNQGHYYINPRNAKKISAFDKAMYDTEMMEDIFLAKGGTNPAYLVGSAYGALILAKDAVMFPLNFLHDSELILDDPRYSEKRMHQFEAIKKDPLGILYNIKELTWRSITEEYYSIKTDIFLGNDLKAGFAIGRDVTSFGTLISSSVSVSKGLSNVVINMPKTVSRSLSKIESGVGEFLAIRDIKFPLTFQFESVGLNCGFPIDKVRIRNPFEINFNKKHAKRLEKNLGAIINREHIDLKTGSGGIHGYENFAIAREHARMRANLIDEGVPFLQEVGPYDGKIYTGMRSIDKSRGWRIDLDPKNSCKGVHINWWFCPDPNKPKLRYKGMIKIDADKETYWDIISHFPARNMR